MIKLLIIIIIWILGMGVLAWLCDNNNNNKRYNIYWYDGAESVLFIMFWIITLPIYGIYKIGRFIPYIIYYIFLNKK